jgi:hypothetical protein
VFIVMQRDSLIVMLVFPEVARTIALEPDAQSNLRLPVRGSMTSPRPVVASV